MNIGSTIKMLRKNRGENQEVMAKAIGVRVPTLSLIETNQTRPQQKTLDAISKHTGVPIALIYIWSVEADDVPLECQDKFKSLWPNVESLAVYVFEKK